MSETATISAAIDVAVRYYRSMVAGDEAELRRLFEALRLRAGSRSDDVI